MKSVLITGAGGLIGSRLAEAARKAGDGELTARHEQQAERRRAQESAYRMQEGILAGLMDDRRTWEAATEPQRRLAVAADAEAALALVYGEFLLREEQGEKPSLEDYQARFPLCAEGGKGVPRLVLSHDLQRETHVHEHPAAGAGPLVEQAHVDRPAHAAHFSHGQVRMARLSVHQLSRDAQAHAYSPSAAGAAAYSS